MGQDEQQANIRTMGSTRHMRKHSRMRELLLDLAQNHRVPKGPIWHTVEVHWEDGQNTSKILSATRRRDSAPKPQNHLEWLLRGAAGATIGHVARMEKPQGSIFRPRIII